MLNETNKKSKHEWIEKDSSETTMNFPFTKLMGCRLKMENDAVNQASLHLRVGSLLF